MTEPPRAPLDAARLRASLTPPWTRLEVVDETESTNADLAGADAGSVLVAEFQRAGRGRLARSWVSPPRAGLLFSAAVRPPVPALAWGWLPLLTGVAVADAVRVISGLPAVLKWPNDVMIDDLKLAGILVQASGDTAVIGVGLNVSTTRSELPVDSATSLAIAGAQVDRGELLTGILVELGRRYTEWTDAAGDAAACGLAADYRALCSTIGRDVSVVTVGTAESATAAGIDDDGRLRVRWHDPATGSAIGREVEQSVAAGDIVHLRVDHPPTSGSSVGG